MDELRELKRATRHLRSTVDAYLDETGALGQDVLDSVSTLASCFLLSKIVSKSICEEVKFVRKVIARVDAKLGPCQASGFRLATHALRAFLDQWGQV